MNIFGSMKQSVVNLITPFFINCKYPRFHFNNKPLIKPVYIYGLLRLLIDSSKSSLKAVLHNVTDLKKMFRLQSVLTQKKLIYHWGKSLMQRNIFCGDLKLIAPLRGIRKNYVFYVFIGSSLYWRSI